MFSGDLPGYSSNQGRGALIETPKGVTESHMAQPVKAPQPNKQINFSQKVIVMGIKNSASAWQKARFHHPHIVKAIEVVGVLALMLALCVEV